jgi:hypothetical protein
MFFAISSPKRGGSGPSRLFDSRKELIEPVRRSLALRLFKKTSVSFVWLLLSSSIILTSAGAGKSSFVPSKAAAERCSEKLDKLESFAAKRKSGQKQTMKFSQDEINSYLALDLSAQYHPCLKSLVVSLEENGVEAVASIDFDRMKSSSGNQLWKLAGLVFSGTHTLTARGKLLSKDGKANFSLDQASFDDATLPRSLVELIITAVGRHQNPPFDPLQPSKLFYEIEKADIHSGYAMVYQ